MARYLTLAEISKHLSISIPTVRRYIAEGKLKTFRCGRVVRVSEEELSKFISNYSSYIDLKELEKC